MTSPGTAGGRRQLATTDRLALRPRAPVASVTWTIAHDLPCPASAHYVALFFILLTGYRLLVPDWRGALIAWLAVVGLANVYMSLFGRLRVDIKAERLEIASKEKASMTTLRQIRGNKPRPARVYRP